MLKRILYISALFITGIIIFSLLLIMLCPAESIGEFISDRAYEEAGVSVKYRSLRRVLPFGIEAEGVEINRLSDGFALYLSSVNIKYQPLMLLFGKAGFKISAKLLTGKADSTVTVGLSGFNTDVKIYSLRPDQLPQAKEYALVLPLILNGNITLARSFTERCPEGTVVIDSSRVGSGKVSVLGFGLDFGANTVGGVRAELKECRVYIKNFWLEGESIVARLSGMVTMGRSPAVSRLDFSAEVNEKQSVNGNRMVLSLLNPYKVTDGYYGIKVGGTVARPSVCRALVR